MALDKRFNDLTKAFERLKEGYKKALENEELYIFFRDATIQRFEFTVEILWKTIKEFLKQIEGIDCKSPKGCIREFFANGYISEEKTKTLLEMIDDRNLTSHTYQEEIAEKIFKDLKSYIPVIEEIINTMEKKICQT